MHVAAAPKGQVPYTLSPATGHISTTKCHTSRFDRRAVEVDLIVMLQEQAVRSVMHVAAAPKGQVPSCPKPNEHLQMTH